MKAHFVTFCSPGTFVAEETTRPVETWSVDLAKQMVREIKERHGATPYGFRFTTRGRTDQDLDSKVIETSPFYWLGGKIETLAEVKARATDQDRILISNMECNKWERVITNSNSWKWTQPLNEADIVLDWEK